jgi:hypothetical protein
MAAIASVVLLWNKALLVSQFESKSLTMRERLREREREGEGLGEKEERGREETGRGGRGREKAKGGEGKKEGRVSWFKIVTLLWRQLAHSAEQDRLETRDALIGLGSRVISRQNIRSPCQPATDQMTPITTERVICLLKEPG